MHVWISGNDIFNVYLKEIQIILSVSVPGSIHICGVIVLEWSVKSRTCPVYFRTNIESSSESVRRHAKETVLYIEAVTFFVQTGDKLLKKNPTPNKKKNSTQSMHRRLWHGITPPFFNFLFTYLFLITFLYYFISFSFIYRIRVHISIQSYGNNKHMPAIYS